MRTRQKLTAVGAFTLAGTAIGGGAFATSHAMADAATPGKGTMTVISMTTGSDGPIKCVYDNIDLPTPPVGLGVNQVGGSADGTSGTFNVITGTGPVDANGDPLPDVVITSSGSAIPSTRDVSGNVPTLVAVNGQTPAVAGGSSSEAGAGEAGPGGPVLSPPLPGGLIAINDTTARPGTTDECAAMKPGAGLTALQPTP
jgi:hypothetical protein